VDLRQIRGSVPTMWHKGQNHCETFSIWAPLLYTKQSPNFKPQRKKVETVTKKKRALSSFQSISVNTFWTKKQVFLTLQSIANLNTFPGETKKKCSFKMVFIVWIFSFENSFAFNMLFFQLWFSIWITFKLKICQFA
jgi:hypothetical protein